MVLPNELSLKLFWYPLSHSILPTWIRFGSGNIMLWRIFIDIESREMCYFRLKRCCNITCMYLYYSRQGLLGRKWYLTCYSSIPSYIRQSTWFRTWYLTRSSRLTTQLRVVRACMVLALLQDHIGTDHPELCSRLRTTLRNMDSELHHVDRRNFKGSDVAMRLLRN